MTYDPAGPIASIAARPVGHGHGQHDARPATRSPVTTWRRSGRARRTRPRPPRPTSASRSRRRSTGSLVGRRRDRAGPRWPSAGSSSGTAGDERDDRRRRRRTRRRRDASTARTTPRPDDDVVIRTQRPDEALRRPGRGRRPRSRGPARRDLRAARPERRRQDDDRADAPRPHGADRRRGPRGLGFDPTPRIRSRSSAGWATCPTASASTAH